MKNMNIRYNLYIEDILEIIFKCENLQYKILLKEIRHIDPQSHITLTLEYNERKIIMKKILNSVFFFICQKMKKVWKYPTDI